MMSLRRRKRKHEISSKTFQHTTKPEGIQQPDTQTTQQKQKKTTTERLTKIKITEDNLTLGISNNKVMYIMHQTGQHMPPDTKIEATDIKHHATIRSETISITILLIPSATTTIDLAKVP